MGGLLTKCKCTSISEPPYIDVDIDVDQAVDSMVTSQQVDTSNNQELQPEKDLYSTSIAETLNSFRFQKLFTDFTINVDGSLFSVHKNVLAASCTFFKDLFNASEDICYEMSNVEPFAVEEVLNFLYIGKCRLHQQNAASVLHVARILGLHDLQEASEKYISVLEKKSLISHISFVSREDSILPAIQEFQLEGLFCDITLTTSCGRVIPVHKNVLTAVSCYFQGLFRSDMKEVHEGNVDFGIIDESVVVELLSFIYSGKISITFDNVRSLLQACDYLLMESLKTTIDEFLKDSLTVSNFWQLFALAKHCDGLSEITKGISKMVLNSYWEITKSDEFLEITEADMRVFLSNDEIVSSEAEMLESLIRWYKNSKQQREVSFKSLLRLIHMPSIPDLYLKFLAEKEGVDELRSCTGHRLKAEIPLDDIKRTAHFYNLALFGITRDSRRYIWYWLPFAGPWSFITFVQHPSCFLRSSPLLYANDAIYLHEYTNAQVQLTFVSNPLSCRHFGTMGSVSFTESTGRVPTSTEDSITVALSEYIYFLGGNTHHEIISTVQRYNMKTRFWDCVSSMQELRYHHFAVSYKDRYIYVFGGVDRVACWGRIYKSTVERYDPEENCWSYVASMHQPRCDGLASVLTDKIFVTGGIKRTCEIYDPLTDEWQLCSFQFNTAYTLKPLRLKELKDAGTFCEVMSCSDDSNEDSRDVNLTLESEELDPIGLKMRLPRDEKCYDHEHVYSPALTYYNGVIIVFNFSSFSKRNLRTLKLPVYFVDPETGNFRILYSLSSWPDSDARGIVMPLSRKDMIKAVKDYPGNKT